MAEEYLNAQQAAAYLGVHRQRIYQLATEGKIGRRIGGYWLFTKAELDAYDKAPKGPGGRPKVDVAGLLKAGTPV